MEIWEAFVVGMITAWMPSVILLAWVMWRQPPIEDEGHD